MKYKICFVTGSRADYGLIKGLMTSLKNEKGFELQLLVTGTHLSDSFGLTVQEIEKDGFIINRRIYCLSDADTSNDVSKAIGVAVSEFGAAISEIEPDLFVVLGDRFEIFSAVTAALVARVPVAHIHGGEVTHGSIDDSFRHAITKMSQFHFVATEEFRNRVIQLGENPENVYLVGGLGVDNVNELELLDKNELEESLGIKFAGKNLLVTFHPATLDVLKPGEQLSNLLAAISTLKETRVIFTSPNADEGGLFFTQKIKEYVANNREAVYIESLGQLNYFSCASVVDGIIGNSSSGLLEIPSLKKGTINLGNRQDGRPKASSVIDADMTVAGILEAIEMLYSEDFKKILLNSKNPYGDGGARQRIISAIRDISTKKVTPKKFYDLPNPGSGKK